jgi:hypothetical protein
MALQSLTNAYIGKGGVYLDQRANSTGAFALGNVKSLSLAIETDRKARVDYQGAGGGELDVIERITSMTGEMVVDDIKAQNLALALRGSVDAFASGPVSGEAITLYSGSRAFFAHIPDPDVAVTVTVAVVAEWAAETAYALGAKIVDGGRLYSATVAGTSGSTEPTWPTNGSTVTDGTVTWKDLGTTTLVEDTHWQRTRTGIEPVATATQFDSYGTALTVAYTRNAQSAVQALTDSGTEYRMYFDSLNEADSGNPGIDRFHRVKFSPTSGLDRIGDEFGEITLAFTVLKDESITASGKSQYLQMAMI